MKIINKTLEPTVREALLSLVKNTDCLVYDASRKRYVRGEIGKIQREDDNLKFKTKVKHGEIYVWRIFLDEKHSIIK